MKKAASDAVTFTGFPPEGLRFLTGLKKNNERSWFNDRKQIFIESVQEPLHAFVSSVNDGLKAKNIPLASDPRRIAFRIYRDVRFSADKSPYKTHVSAVLHYRGNREAPGVLYLHIDPKEPFLAAGFYRPEVHHLRMLRESIASDAKAFLALQKKLARHGLHMRDDEERLTRLPRGFEDIDESLAPFIKQKTFIVSRPLEPADLQSKNLTKSAVTFAAAALPLLEWGWEALR